MEFFFYIPRVSFIRNLFLKVEQLNKETYVDTLRLRDVIRRKRPQKWRTKWVPIHDSAPTHRCILVKRYLAKYDVTTLGHPAHSPDLSPADFYYFV